MNHLLIRHTVADFDAWNLVYEAHQAARQAAGLKQKELLRDVSNPNQVVILFEVSNLQKAREFIDSADLRTTMTKAGVIGTPDLYLLR